ncbi:uncharacterized protein MYCFIDRAFT_180552 [Pseudocercospora fijiensis CIRAD86]|uniref:Uncharacterized protein n=1 Tax=Pseudocercospora fijiensis (strain CIRAD86) TaxID=383855 RepID=M3AI58_PSEFD|nr:uncharacterized protein MYCFIDRAFT_180552 [Pseudocercospora fijiensis CIRAD86]EME76893.1 hypothetical protein MYCFIDRAFT_180552 [Pseudocercospora fijiensis CIRAD86]
MVADGGYAAPPGQLRARAGQPVREGASWRVEGQVVQRSQCAEAWPKAMPGCVRGAERSGASRELGGTSLMADGRQRGSQIGSGDMLLNRKMAESGVGEEMYLIIHRSVAEPPTRGLRRGSFSGDITSGRVYFPAITA